jgi:hypothetical protein
MISFFAFPPPFLDEDMAEDGGRMRIRVEGWRGVVLKGRGKSKKGGGVGWRGSIYRSLLTELRDGFCLPPAKSGRRLFAMRRKTPLGVPAGPEAREFGPAALGFVPTGSPHAPPVRTRGETPVDTFHCSSDVAGSAVQFNSSVSAMPDHPKRTFVRPPHPGTANTLLLRSA